MSNNEKSFIDKCVGGEAMLDEIDDYVDLWHESDTENELHAFLGMTENEYAYWVSDPSVLPFIITAHKRMESLENIMAESKA